MKKYTIHVQTQYNYWFNIPVLAINEFSAIRIGRRWSKNKYFSDCVYRVFATENS